MRVLSSAYIASLSIIDMYKCKQSHLDDIGRQAKLAKRRVGSKAHGLARSGPSWLIASSRRVSTCSAFILTLIQHRCMVQMYSKRLGSQRYYHRSESRAS